MADQDKTAESDVISTAKDRWQKAFDAYGPGRSLAIEDTKFVLGDSDNSWQWPAEMLRQRAQIDKKPCLTVNVTRQHCNQIINNIRQNRPQCKVLPSDAKAAKKTAEIYAGLIRSIQAQSHADVAHDEAAKHAVFGGEGYWTIYTDWVSEDSFDQQICIGPIENPQLVYVDPFCGLDKKKAKWGFIFEDISKEEAKKKYGKDGVDPTTWVMDTARGWVMENTCRIAKYYYCEEVKDTLIMLGDGTTILESELKKQGGEEAVQQAKEIAKAQEEQGLGRKTRPTTRTQWKHCKIVGGHDKPLEVKDWPGSYLPIIQVVGDETNVNGEIIRKGVVRDLKDPARIVNYSYSATVEGIALQSKIPYVGPLEAFEGLDDHWAQANTANKAYLPYNQYDDQGQKLDRPERQAPAVLPAAQVSLLQLSIEQMRAASGQQNANFGIKSEAQSGVGIQRLKVQGETATFHFPDNLARALHDEAVILIDLIPKVYDTRRVVQLLGIDGKEEKAMLDPDLGGAYELFDEEDVKHAFNPGVGKYSAVIDTGPSYQTQRQEGAAAMTELATKNPQLLQVAGDIVMKAYDFPFSDQLAERLRKTLPPQLQEDAGRLPPEAEAQIAQMQGLIEQLGQALEATQAELEKAQAGDWAKYNDALIKAYDAETKRISALGGAMTPEIVQALVMQVLQDVTASPPLDPVPPNQQPTENEPPPGGFSLPSPEMAATGANPGPGDMPVLPEGNPQ